MPNFVTQAPRYHHFILRVWEERDSEEQHITWRFSLQDSREEARIGFKNIDDLKNYLERWMEDSSSDHAK